MSSEELKVMNHGTGHIKIIVDTNKVAEADLSEVHMKEDGTTDDKPSLAFVSMIIDYAVVSQVSLKMLNDAFKALGYQIIKYNKKK